MTTLPFVSTKQQSTAIALVVACGYLLLLYLLARRGGYELAADTPQQRLMYLSWIGLGHFVVAAVPAYLFAEYGLFLPAAVFVGIVGYTLAVEGSTQADSALAIYGMFWVVPLAVLIVAAGIEYGIRSAVLS